MIINRFDLNVRLMTGIKRPGHETPISIQKAAIPSALAGHDLIGPAQTGTVKTAAFVLPILNSLSKVTQVLSGNWLARACEISQKSRSLGSGSR